MRDIAWFVWLLPRNIGVLLIRAYRAVVSPLYGDVCRYYPSCSAYGLGSVQHRGLVVGSLLTGWRILRCNPWSRGGVDDVRMARQRRVHVTPFGFVVPVGWAGASRSRGRHALAGHAHPHAEVSTRSAAAPSSRESADPELSPSTSRKD